MASKKKVAIIGTNGLPANYGGFETLAHHLVLNLANDFDITVYCSKTPTQKKISTYNRARLKYIPLKANGWQSVIYDIISIFHAYWHSDVLVILGFSGAIAFPFNRIFKKNIVFNIGGIEWQKVRGSKFSAGLEIRIKKWMEMLCVKNSKSVIIDNFSFKEYLEEEYNIKPILAEYGGDHTQRHKITDSLKEKYPFLSKPYDITVSRAQPDMNIHMVIEAYKAITNRTVVIISNWNISDYGLRLFKENHDKYQNIILLNAIYEPVELNTLRSNCEIYIHTHSLCGTAPSLVEAMSLALPVISFDVPANRSTTEDKAFYFQDAAGLVHTLRNLTQINISSNLNHMAQIAKSRYKWERISNIYRSVLQ